MFVDIIKLKRFVMFVESYEENELSKMTIVFFFSVFASCLTWFVKKLETLTNIEQHIIDLIPFAFHFYLQAGYTL